MERKKCALRHIGMPGWDEAAGLECRTQLDWNVGQLDWNVGPIVTGNIPT